VCQMLDISYPTYKTWEKKGWFPKPRREEQSNYRVFNEDELAELKQIFKAKARRFKGKNADHS